MPGLALPDATPLEPDVAEALMLEVSARGQHWPQVAADLDLGMISEACETEIADGLRARFLKAEAQRKADLSDRAEMQLATLDRRVERARRRLEEIIEKLRRRSLEDDSKKARGAAKAAALNEGKLKRLLERAEQRRAKIQSARDMSAEVEGLAVCVVEVVA